jgi:hypothetical protein
VEVTLSDGENVAAITVKPGACAQELLNKWLAKTKLQIPKGSARYAFEDADGRPIDNPWNDGAFMFIKRVELTPHILTPPCSISTDGEEQVYTRVLIGPCKLHLWLPRTTPLAEIIAITRKTTGIGGIMEAQEVKHDIMERVIQLALRPDSPWPFPDQAIGVEFMETIVNLDTETCKGVVNVALPYQEIVDLAKEGQNKQGNWRPVSVTEPTSQKPRIINAVQRR